MFFLSLFVGGCATAVDLRNTSVQTASDDPIKKDVSEKGAISVPSEASKEKQSANNSEAISSTFTLAQRPDREIKLRYYREHPKFLAWVASIAQATGIPQNWLVSKLGQAKQNERVQQLMAVQTTGVKNWIAYRSRFIEPERVKRGKAFLESHREILLQAEQRFGVPAPIIASIIGVETMYGKIQGNFKVLDSLATLAWSYPTDIPDRTAFFQGELLAYLQFCYQSQCNPDKQKGSYAGAIGISQFMPSNILSLAVDFDNDGKIDLTSSTADAIGSVANYLKHHGWQNDLPIAFDYQAQKEVNLVALLEKDIVPSLTEQQLTEYGITLGQPLLQFDQKLAWSRSADELYAFIQLENAKDDPYYLIGTKNFYVITRYNNSAFYATAVIALAAEFEKH